MSIGPHPGCHMVAHVTFPAPPRGNRLLPGPGKYQSAQIKDTYWFVVPTPEHVAIGRRQLPADRQSILPASVELPDTEVIIPLFHKVPYGYLVPLRWRRPLAQTSISFGHQHESHYLTTYPELAPD